MSILHYFRSLFPEKKKRGLIIRSQPQLPIIDPRTPLITLPPKPEVEVDMNTWEEKAEEVVKSCSVCKFGVHDVSLGDLESIICTLNPNKPCIVLLVETCDKHEPKYSNLKVIVDKGTLMEYDSEQKSLDKKLITKIIPTEIGEDEWQQ